MAKKAKKSKGKSKGKSSKSKSDPDANFVSAHAFHALHDDAQMLAAKTDWVRLDIALVNWAHMHFTVLVRADSTMHTIARIIQEKTGSIGPPSVPVHTGALLTISLPQMASSCSKTLRTSATRSRRCGPP